MSELVSPRESKENDDDFSSNPADDTDFLPDRQRGPSAIIIGSTAPENRSGLVRMIIIVFMIANAILALALFFYRPPETRKDEEIIEGSPRNWCTFEETDVETAPYFKYNGTLRKFKYKFASYARPESLSTHHLEWSLSGYELPFDTTADSICSATLVVVHPLGEKKNFMVALRFNYENLKNRSEFRVYYNHFETEHSDEFIRNQVDDFQKHHLDLKHRFLHPIKHERDGKTLKLDLHISRYPHEKEYIFTVALVTEKSGEQLLGQRLPVPISEATKEEFYIMQFGRHGLFAPWKATSKARCTLKTNDKWLCRDGPNGERFCVEDDPW